MLHVLLVLCMLVCAVQAVRAKQLLTSALWLAGVSALIALTLYTLGAAQIAVIELSVGAGLVTVLFVFAINIASDEDATQKQVVPAWLTWLLAGVSVLLLGWLALPTETAGAIPELPFTTILWEQRGMDVMVQIILIFAAVLGLLGLLGESKSMAQTKKEQKDPEAAVVTVDITE